MGRESYIRGKNSFGVDLSTCEFLGEGCSGKVYKLENGYVIKIFKSSKSCYHEYSILKKAENDVHFPKAIDIRKNAMIREYVDGIELSPYIKRYGLSKELAVNIINLVKAFRKLGFKKLDTRCAHIFVQSDEAIMVIDPRRVYEKRAEYPAKILNCLKKAKCLEKFMYILREEDLVLFVEWSIRLG